MRRFAGACRFVFNRALALQNENHEAGNKYIPYGKMASWLVEWKNATETQWLKDSPSQPLQQSLKDPERAYKNFFRKRAAFPRFKKRGQNDAFRSCHERCNSGSSATWVEIFMPVDSLPSA